jgi:hypothetical protein
MFAYISDLVQRELRVDRLARKFVIAVRGRLKSKFAVRIFATDDASLRNRRNRRCERFSERFRVSWRRIRSRLMLITRGVR